MGAAMSSLNVAASSENRRPMSSSSELPFEDQGGILEKPGASGLLCGSLAEDLAFSWPELQERFQSLAPHIRQVGIAACSSGREPASSRLQALVD